MGDVTCPICAVETEENMHVFVRCNYAQEVWGAANIPLPPPSIIEFKDWLLYLVNNVGKETFAKAMMLIWGIWKNRNTQVWEGSKQHPHDVVLMTMGWLEDFMKANSSEQQRSARSRGWTKPPPEGWLKCNIDGAFKAQSGQNGAGIVFRDSRGQFRAASARHLLNITTPFHPELQAMSEAIKMATDLSYNRVIFETDCSMLAAALKQEEGKFSMHSFLIEDVKELLRSQVEFQVNFASREAN
ncbi:uncharacterized protein LOC112171071 [Rosa chinensis]|uniref:uncharacterized protein LOC112171071 n=1 Tax=Rosa chinensis TaxID=74649 RepID=UPI000D08B7E4|nr:uncharacterized protein LOC112171071 [Rosa chinensis]